MSETANPKGNNEKPPANETAGLIGKIRSTLEGFRQERNVVFPMNYRLSLFRKLKGTGNHGLN